MGFVSKSISFPDKTLAKLIKKKGRDTPLSRFVCRALEEWLGIPEEQRTVYPD